MLLGVDWADVDCFSSFAVSPLCSFSFCSDGEKRLRGEQTQSHAVGVCTPIHILTSGRRDSVFPTPYGLHVSIGTVLHSTSHSCYKLCTTTSVSKKAKSFRGRDAKLQTP